MSVSPSPKGPVAPVPQRGNHWASALGALIRFSLLPGLLFGFSLCQAAQYSIVVPAGTTLIGNPLNNGNNAANLVFPNPDPGQNYSGPFDGDALAIYNCTNGAFHTVFFDSVTADTPTGFTDVNGNPVPAPILAPGCAFGFENGKGAAQTIVFTGTIPAPVLPPPCYCGCGVLSYVSLQGTNTGTFQSLTGFAPSQGDELVTWNGGAFATNTFLNGAWTGATPVINPAVGYGVIIPCSSCASVTNQQFTSNAPSLINYSFQLANNTAIPVKYLLLVPETNCFTVVPDILTFQPPLQPGQATRVSVTLYLNGNCGTNLCLLMSLQDSNLVVCCSREVCLQPGTNTCQPQVSMQFSNGMIVVTWSGSGILQSATAVTGPWSDVPGATSPYSVRPSGTRFYRVRCP